MSQISFPNSDISLLPTDMPVILDWADNIGQGYLNLFFFFGKVHVIFDVPKQSPQQQSCEVLFSLFLLRY